MNLHKGPKDPSRSLFAQPTPDFHLNLIFEFNFNLIDWLILISFLIFFQELCLNLSLAGVFGWYWLLDPYVWCSVSVLVLLTLFTRINSVLSWKWIMALLLIGKYILSHDRFEKWYFCYQNCSDLLWEKNCSSVQEKLLKFEVEGREFANILRSLEQFIHTVKGQNNFW